MTAGPLIALTTDFGWGSSYVAQLKAVVLSSLPTARIVDIAHDLPKHSVRAGELLLRSTALCFPLGTTHIVVIDPGVGTERRAIAMEAAGMTFVGPDNGVLGLLAERTDARAVVLDQPHLFLHPVAKTFAGRDIFAPVACELAAGLTLTDVGTPIDEPAGSTLPVPRIEDDRIIGETIGADRFGNLTTNIRNADAGSDPRVDDQSVPRFDTYGDAPADTLFVLSGSDGYLEVALKCASAAAHLEKNDGSTVSLQHL